MKAMTGALRHLLGRVKRYAFVRQPYLPWLLYLFSLPVPNKRGLVVFSMARGRYSYNSRPLFEHLSSGGPGISALRAVWLADERFRLTDVPEQFRKNVIPRKSLYGWYLCAAADVVVISHGLSDFGQFEELVKHKKVMVVWHGITIKHIGMFDRTYDATARKKYQKQIARYYDRMVASSDIDRYYSASYTGIPSSAIIVTGLPRNDCLFREPSGRRNEMCPAKFLYAPTYRDYATDHGSVFFPFQHDIEEIASWATECKVQFHLRPHPNDLESVTHVARLSSKYPHVFIDVGINVCHEVMDLIISCNGIITDYSSIYIDGLALDRPVVFVDCDRERYTEVRGFAYDYELVTPGPKVRSWLAFRSACEEMVTGAKRWAEHRENVRKIFFKYRDAGACRRVATVIEDMMSE